jgi:hypothetical protein
VRWAGAGERAEIVQISGVKFPLELSLDKTSDLKEFLTHK